MNIRADLRSGTRRKEYPWHIASPFADGTLDGAGKKSSLGLI